LIDTAHKQSVPAVGMHQRADCSLFLALLVHPRSHRHNVPVFCSASKSTRYVRACHSMKTNSAEAHFCPMSLYILQTDMFLFSLCFPARKTVETNKCVQLAAKHPCLENWPQALLHGNTYSMQY